MSCISKHIPKDPQDDGEPVPDPDWDAVMAMTEAEIDAELAALGIDMPAFIARVRARIAEVLAADEKKAAKR